MMPIPSAIKSKLFKWLPHDLAGYDYPLIETDNIVPNLTAPAITYYFSSFAPSSPGWRYIGSVRERLSGNLREIWGSYFFTTMNVVLRANVEGELSAMWLDFITQIESTRRDLLLRWDGIRYDGILGMRPLVPERLPDGKNLYWAQVDLRFEFVIYGTPVGDVIKRVHTDLTTFIDDGGREATLSFDREVYTKEISVGIKALIM